MAYWIERVRENCRDVRTTCFAGIENEIVGAEVVGAEITTENVSTEL